VIEWFVIDKHVGRDGLLGGVVGDFSFSRYASGIDPAACFAAGTIAEVSEELIKTAWRHASIGRGVDEGRKNEREAPGLILISAVFDKARNDGAKRPFRGVYTLRKTSFVPLVIRKATDCIRNRAANPPTLIPENHVLDLLSLLLDASTAGSDGAF